MSSAGLTKSRLKHQRHPPLKEDHFCGKETGRWDRIQGLGRFSLGCCFAASKDSRVCSSHLFELFLESLGHPSTLQRTSLEPALASLRQPFCLAYLLIWLKAHKRERGGVAELHSLQFPASHLLNSSPNLPSSRGSSPARHCE